MTGPMRRATGRVPNGIFSNLGPFGAPACRISGGWHRSPSERRSSSARGLPSKKAESCSTRLGWSCPAPWGVPGLVHLELRKVGGAPRSATFDLAECISVLRTRLGRSIDSPLPIRHREPYRCVKWRGQPVETEEEVARGNKEVGAHEQDQQLECPKKDASVEGEIFRGKIFRSAAALPNQDRIPQQSGRLSRKRQPRRSER